jgi:NADPH2:quinone reductase
LPKNVSFDQGAAIGVPYATAFRALFTRGDSKPGETVLIHGASGGVGIAAVQLARAAGLTIIGTAGTDKGLALVKEQGAQHVVNHHSAEHFDEVMKLTGGIGVPIIIEFASHQNLGKDLGVLAKNGRVIVVGSRGPVQINPRDLMMRDADIRGMSLMNATEAELAGIHAALVAGLEYGTLRPVIGAKFPLADAPKAHEAIINERAFGKIVLIP